MPNAEIMIHQVAVHGNGLQGKATDIQILVDQIKKKKKRVNQILADNTGKSVEQVTIDTERDHYMSAEEALEYGIIDRIIMKR